MHDGIRSRGVASTVLMSLASEMAGLFWIGRPRLALLVLAVQVVAAGLVIWVGFPPEIDAMGTLLVAYIVARVVFVLVFRKRSRPLGWSSRWYSALALGMAFPLLLALGFRVLVAQPFSIPGSGGSMAPNLVGGDYMFISKWAYGYSRYSLPFAPSSVDGRLFARAPERGDVVVFKYPPNPELDYVKRVVGLPGERIEVRRGVLHIDGVAVRRERISGSDGGPTGIPRGVAVYRETLANGVTYDTMENGPDSILNTTREFVVPDDALFVLGDFRDNSADSRVFGFVPLDNLLGRAERIFWNSQGLSYRERRSLRPERAEPGSR